MKKFIKLSLVISLIFTASASFACSHYKKTEGYNYLKNREAEAIQYKNNLPEEEKIDISNDVTQVNSERKKLLNKYSEIYEMKLTSKRYLKRQKDELDSFEEMGPQEENIEKRIEENENEDKSL